MAAVYIIMGVSGCGKTTIGKMLSEQLGIPFYDADDRPAGVEADIVGRLRLVPWVEVLHEATCNEEK